MDNLFDSVTIEGHQALLKCYDNNYLIRLISYQGQMSIRVFTPEYVVTDKGSEVHDRVVMHTVIPCPKRPVLDRMGIPIDHVANEGGGGVVALGFFDGSKFDPKAREFTSLVVPKPKEFWHTRAIKELLKTYPKKLVAIMMDSSVRSVSNWADNKTISSAKCGRLAHVVRETKTEVPK